MKNLIFLTLAISLIVFLSCQNPQETVPRTFLVWTLGPQSISGFNPNTDDPNYGVGIEDSSSQTHRFLTSDGTNLWSLGL